MCYKERACKLLYFDVARGKKRAFCSFEYCELSIILSPQSSILNPRHLVLEVSRATVLVFTYTNKKICLETAVFRVYREGLRREWIENTFPQVPRRQRSVHKMDSRDTERCWMRWEISASTQSFTLREKKTPWASRPWQPLFSNHKSERFLNVCKVALLWRILCSYHLDIAAKTSTLNFSIDWDLSF